MTVYMLEHRWEIVRHYFENHGNVAECVQKLRTDFGRRKAPSAPYVQYLVKKVKETRVLTDIPKREESSTSIHRRSQQLNISETSLRRILHKDFGMMPYNVQLV